MNSNIKIGNVIQKKCCDAIGCLFFFFTIKPHELKSKKPILRSLYSSLPDVTCCSNTVLIQKNYANDVLIQMKIVDFCLAAFSTSGK